MSGDCNNTLIKQYCNISSLITFWARNCASWSLRSHDGMGIMRYKSVRLSVHFWASFILCEGFLFYPAEISLTLSDTMSFSSIIFCCPDLHIFSCTIVLTPSPPSPRNPLLSPCSQSFSLSLSAPAHMSVTLSVCLIKVFKTENNISCLLGIYHYELKEQSCFGLNRKCVAIYNCISVFPEVTVYLQRTG